ncbi:perlucin-like [Asterias amurensis]|uniref:perlucin-like n=1 Tax=Asterias amurensis TaxID=7602 RepID=UPI003AB13E8E
MALLESYCFKVVASQYQQCSTFMSDDPSCPESWHQWGNSCYRVIESRVSLSEARDRCRQLGGVLPVPSSSQEDAFIYTLIPKGELVWLDCNDLELEGRWKCKEGNVEVSYRNWDTGEPNRHNEHCAVYSGKASHNGWHDVECNRQEMVICKMAFRPVLHV